jgi:hypothetical protein
MSNIFSPHYYVDYAIDTVQGTKSFFVKTLVSEEKVQKPLQEFIDLQTSFAKSAYRAAYSAMTESFAYLQKQSTAK